MPYICPTCQSLICNEDEDHNPFAGCWYEENINDEWGESDIEVGDYLYLETSALGSKSYRKVDVVFVSNRYIIVPSCTSELSIFSTKTGINIKEDSIYPCIKLPKHRRCKSKRTKHKVHASKLLKLVVEEWKDRIFEHRICDLREKRMKSKLRI